MNITKLLSKKANSNMNEPGVTIAFLGDSITQGCFELYKKSKTDFETVFDKNHAYHTYIAKILSILYPSVPVNIINAGISGDNAPHAYERIERDVISHAPDLVVVCFGLNDCGAGKDGLINYTTALENIFRKLNDNNIETIFMTPNIMNTYLSYHITDETFKDIAKSTLKCQNEGILDLYIDSAKEICKKYNISVCDTYKVWKTLNENGVDTTELLSNKINHPTREMNWLPAMLLVEQMFK